MFNSTTVKKQSLARCPVGKIAGGRHGDTKQEGNKNDKEKATESHHLIGAAISDLLYDEAPAIRMNREDHYLTANHNSNGKSVAEREDWVAKQAALVAEGNYDEALEMGINDVKDKFPGKYDAAIEQMMASLPKKADGKIDWSKLK